VGDLNEPKKETARVPLPPPAGAEPPATNLRSPPSVPVRPPSPIVRPPAPAPSGSVRPSDGPPPPAGLEPPVSPPHGARSPAASGPSGPVLPSINRPLESRGLVQADPRKERVPIADSLTRAAVKPSNVQPASVPLASAIRTASPVVANPPPKGQGESVPAQLCWALLGISALTLLMQLWNYFS
jgi:hypothetical protein